MTKQLAKEGARLDAIYSCPHVSADNCDCRKPKPGLLRQAAREHHLDLQRSFVVGDRYGDVELAHRASACGILVRTGYGEGELLWRAGEWPKPPDFVADDLAAAAAWILGQSR